jgi:hypothetical protein
MLRSSLQETILRSSLEETILPFFFFLIFKQIKNALKLKKIIIKNSTKSSLQETISKSTLYFDITLKVPCLAI